MYKTKLLHQIQTKLMITAVDTMSFSDPLHTISTRYFNKIFLLHWGNSIYEI